MMLDSVDVIVDYATQLQTLQRSAIQSLSQQEQLLRQLIENIPT